ncbi:MAG: hypothetical protein K2Q03_08700 [Sphingobacteriaceae bacterium]|nr:hypothetical protein [Flavobacteriaceae bacterium]MBY0245515.1 hypothetical protein [Sphingobacteriaceae bacterium]
MKRIKLITVIFGCLFFGCNQVGIKTTKVTEEKVTTETDDKEQIQNLIRHVYNWHETQKPSEMDMIIDEKDSTYIGYNLNQLKLNIEELKATNFFSNEFIDNYNKIYITLDKKLRNKELEWLVGDLPPFGNDANPWCNCQDVPYNQPNPWDFIEIKIINLDNNKGELIWKWGNLELNKAEGWKEFTYKFRVVKESNEWKISYLEGFNFDKFTRKNY